MVLVDLNLNDANGEEPYIRLPAPHSHIIITPPRSLHQTQQQQQKQEGGEGKNENEIIPPQPDIDATFTALNDERVHPYLESPPYPYKREHAVGFHRMMYEECQRILHHPSEQGLYNGCPFRDIRDTSSSPAGSVSQAPKVGDILISRYMFYEFLPDSEQRAKAQAYNNSLAVGHEDLVWGIGCMFPPFPLFLLHFSLPFSLYVTDTFGSLVITLPPRKRNHERCSQHSDRRMAYPKDECACFEK